LLLKALGMVVWGIKRAPSRCEESSETLTYLGGPGEMTTAPKAVDFLVLAVSLCSEIRSLIAGAGLDVFWQEPINPQEPIFDYNVIASPHIVGVTDYSFELMARAVADSLERLHNKKPLLNTVY